VAIAALGCKDIAAGVHDLCHVFSDALMQDFDVKVALTKVFHDLYPEADGDTALKLMEISADCLTDEGKREETFRILVDKFNNTDKNQFSGEICPSDYLAYCSDNFKSDLQMMRKLLNEIKPDSEGKFHFAERLGKGPHYLKWMKNDCLLDKDLVIKSLEQSEGAAFRYLEQIREDGFEYFSDLIVDTEIVMKAINFIVMKLSLKVQQSPALHLV